jgi:hypothetical protein
VSWTRFEPSISRTVALYFIYTANRSVCHLDRCERCVSIYLWLYSPLLDRGVFSVSCLIFYIVDRTPWTGDQPVARPLRAHRTALTQNKCTQTSMPWVGFKPTIPAFKRTKTVWVCNKVPTKRARNGTRSSIVFKNKGKNKNKNQVFRAQADWTLTHMSHKDTEQSTIEVSITLDGVTLTDSLIRWSPNEWPSVYREIPQYLPIRCSGRLISLHNEHSI